MTFMTHVLSVNAYIIDKMSIKKKKMKENIGLVVKCKVFF